MEQKQSILRNSILKMEDLKVTEAKLDTNCPFMASYISDESVFWKNAYNWHSLPLITQWNFKDPSVLSIKNLGIKFNHFILGIITKKDLTALTPTPWRTESTICYESKAESHVIHGESVSLPARVVNNGEILSLVTRKGVA